MLMEVYAVDQRMQVAFDEQRVHAFGTIHGSRLRFLIHRADDVINAMLANTVDDHVRTVDLVQFDQ